MNFGKEFPGYREQIRKEVDKGEEKWKVLFQLQLLKSDQIPSNLIDKEVNGLLLEINKIQAKSTYS